MAVEVALGIRNGVARGLSGTGPGRRCSGSDHAGGGAALAAGTGALQRGPFRVFPAPSFPASAACRRGAPRRAPFHGPRDRQARAVLPPEADRPGNRRTRQSAMPPAALARHDEEKSRAGRSTKPMTPAAALSTWTVRRHLDSHGGRRRPLEHARLEPRRPTSLLWRHALRRDLDLRLRSKGSGADQRAKALEPWPAARRLRRLGHRRGGLSLECAVRRRGPRAPDAGRPRGSRDRGARGNPPPPAASAGPIFGTLYVASARFLLGARLGCTRGRTRVPSWRSTSACAARLPVNSRAEGSGGARAARPRRRGHASARCDRGAAAPPPPRASRPR